MASFAPSRVLLRGAAAGQQQRTRRSMPAGLPSARSNASSAPWTTATAAARLPQMAVRVARKTTALRAAIDGPAHRTVTNDPTNPSPRALQVRHEGGAQRRASF